ncbi:magnesium transporter [Limimonas halophila]|uniref:Magnesium transport protein CorA n=1 Tax=Limimonas halophila TaxID=1082479 RepID=A0A1G7U1F1_9PROT|nr:magnesium transporter CorA family protein [Limimonas halophila]SDG40879.1 magnesium transporter [Limimonas halophila]
MLRAFSVHEGRLHVEEVDAAAVEALPPEAVWIDLYQPTGPEERLVERALAIDIPTRAEREEIESSSRLYTDSGTSFLTGTIVRSAAAPPESATVTFVLTASRLITVRHADLQAFTAFERDIRRQPQMCTAAPSAFAALLDSIIERIADVLERLRSDLDRLSQEVFAERTKASDHDYRALLGRIGRLGDLVSKARESLLSLSRVTAFARQLDLFDGNRAAASRLMTVAQDIASLTDHAAFLNSKVTFLLDATLGMISIQQNAIIKIFSVVAVIFLPPTLIASIYGMNFEVMPELSWSFGYPLALVLMLISAVLPYVLFKARGWL